MPKGVYPRKKRSLASRFWPKVDVKGSDECWEWAAVKTSRGYGQVWNGEKKMQAHRVAWELTHGPIPDGFCVLHHCDNRACVNPAHLWLGTNADNMADATGKGRMARGERNGRAGTKLTSEKVREARISKIPQYTIAARLGVSRSAISLIKSGKTWAWLK